MTQIDELKNGWNGAAGYEKLQQIFYKNNGGRSDCNSYRGNSRLNIAGKAFARFVLSRLQNLAERIYLEYQGVFRSERSTSDMISNYGRNAAKRDNHYTFPPST